MTHGTITKVFPWILVLAVGGLVAFIFWTPYYLSGPNHSLNRSTSDTLVHNLSMLLRDEFSDTGELPIDLSFLGGEGHTLRPSDRRKTEMSAEQNTLISMYRLDSLSKQVSYSPKLHYLPIELSVFAVWEVGPNKFSPMTDSVFGKILSEEISRGGRGAQVSLLELSEIDLEGFFRRIRARLDADDTLRIYDARGDHCVFHYSWGVKEP